MSNPEILEFLELQSNATDADIQRRALEKKAFFEKLLQSAPNAVLKKLHTQNLEKTLNILSTLGVSAAPSPSEAKSYSGSASSNHIAEATAQIKSSAWLVRHTENKPVKSFSLAEGKNIIGRERHAQFNSIIIDQDEYVSRQHAVLELTSYPAQQAYISDGFAKPSKNGTYINGNETAITRKYKLNPGDTIQIGMTKLVFKSDAKSNVRQIERDVEESDYMKTIIINL